MTENLDTLRCHLEAVDHDVRARLKAGDDAGGALVRLLAHVQAGLRALR